MTGAAEPDAVVAARVRAWLDVGGSWAAIASAHGAGDVDAFRQHVTAHLARPEPPRRERPVHWRCSTPRSRAERQTRRRGTI
jgi:hypothetical protein